MRLKIFIILACLISGLFLVNHVAADTCATRPAGGNHTISDACSFPNALDGVDVGIGATNTAVLTISATGTLTVGVGTTATVGSIGIGSSGSIVMIGGTAPNRGTIFIGTPLYATDADADGYPGSITNFFTTSAADRVRRNTLTAITADCNDAAYSATNTCCVDTWVCDTCYDTCCATCCDEHQNCGGTCPDCASGPFAGCSNYTVWNEPYHTCYCDYCQINYSCEPCSNCNPHECNCHWACI